MLTPFLVFLQTFKNNLRLSSFLALKVLSLLLSPNSSLTLYLQLERGP